MTKPVSIVHQESRALHWFEHQNTRQKECLRIVTQRPCHGNLIDRIIEAIKPDIVVVDRGHSETVIIDVAIPRDDGVKDSEIGKIIKYQDLALEISKSVEYYKKTKALPLVTGALRAKYKIIDCHFLKYKKRDIHVYTII